MAGIPGAEDLFDVDGGVSAEDELDAALASIDAEFAIDPQQDLPEPIGRTLAFDWDRGRFVRQGQSAARVSGRESVRQWCLAALRTRRRGSRVFSDAFGMDDPEGPLGGVVEPEDVALVEADVVETLEVHDRVAEVVNVSVRADPTSDTMIVEGFDVVVDDDDPETMRFSDLYLRY